MSRTERPMDIGITPSPPAFSQLGILVLDGSGSMADPAEGQMSKAQAVSIAVRQMLTRFNRSRYKLGFHFAVVTFDGHARVHTPTTSVTAIPDNADYDPLRGHGGTTNLAAALRLAGQLADDFLATATDDMPASVVTIVMSDGIDDDPAATLRVAAEIKRNPENVLCTVYFAQPGAVEPAAQQHLRAVATYPTVGFTTVYDEEALRKFFISSVSVGMNLSPL